MRRKSKSNEQKPDVRRENTALIANNVEQDRKTNTTTGRFRNVATWDADLSKRFASFMQTEFPGVTRMFENKFMEVKIAVSNSCRVSNNRYFYLTDFRQRIYLVSCSGRSLFNASSCSQATSS